MPNFVKIGQTVAKILRFFDFSRWRPPPSWIIEIVNFYLLTLTGGRSRINVPNFVKIGRSVGKIFKELTYMSDQWSEFHAWWHKWRGLMQGVPFGFDWYSKTANVIKTHRHIAKISMWCWVISPFNDFCSFSSMAVNTIDKLQFLSFIFAVLSPVTAHF